MGKIYGRKNKKILNVQHAALMTDNGWSKEKKENIFKQP